MKTQGLQIIVMKVINKLTFVRFRCVQHDTRRHFVCLRLLPGGVCLIEAIQETHRPDDVIVTHRFTHALNQQRKKWRLLLSLATFLYNIYDLALIDKETKE